MTDLDDDLAAAVRYTGRLRTGFYFVVLLVALAGQVTGAVERLHLPWYIAAPAVGALELGGMVVLSNADVRRRLGERAVASRLLSAGIAGFAVAFNWLCHADHLLGGFFAGMSLLGYLVWLMSTENNRRDRLRATGNLPPVPPTYGAWRWLRQPAQTAQARSLALAQGLGLYASLEAVQQARQAERKVARQQRRHVAIAEVLRRKVTATADKMTAEIATTVYDMDRIAAQLAATADYAGLTGLIAADLMPGRLLGDQAVSWQTAESPFGMKPAAEPILAITADADPVPGFSLAELMPVRAVADPDQPQQADSRPQGINADEWRPVDTRPAVAVSWAQIPAEVIAEVRRDLPSAEPVKPAPRRTATSARKATSKKRGKRAAASPRRSAEETRRLAAEATAKDPTLSRTEVAKLLGITPRRLGQVLAGETARINGADVTTATP